MLTARAMVWFQFCLGRTQNDFKLIAQDVMTDLMRDGSNNVTSLAIGRHVPAS